jgi:hypothetical protein
VRGVSRSQVADKLASLPLDLEHAMNPLNLRRPLHYRAGPRLFGHVGAVLAEQHDEWAESRRYFGLDVLSKSRLTTDNPTEQEATPAALTA